MSWRMPSDLVADRQHVLVRYRILHSLGHRFVRCDGLGIIGAGILCRQRP
jgi:hypothetical protein